MTAADLVARLEAILADARSMAREVEATTLSLRPFAADMMIEQVAAQLRLLQAEIDRVLHA